MSHKKYSKNFLNEVIFQIRFSPLLQLYTDQESAAAEFQNVVGHEFKDVKFQQSKKVSVTIDNNTGKAIESKTNDEFLTWIFISDKGKHIRLNGKELILSYGENSYHDFNEFYKDIELALKGLNKFTVPKIKFIGLRYVNQIKIKDYSLLDEYINPNLHLINKEFDKENLIQSINRTELKIDDYRLAFQFGQFNPEYPNVSSKKEFILDYDCILDDDEEFNNITDNLHKMHDIISNRFENDIKDRLREEMGVIS